MSWPWHWYVTGPVISQAGDRLHAEAAASRLPDLDRGPGRARARSRRIRRAAAS